jgi:hypothetical protein
MKMDNTKKDDTRKTNKVDDGTVDKTQKK